NPPEIRLLWTSGGNFIGRGLPVEHLRGQKSKKKVRMVKNSVKTTKGAPSGKEAEEEKSP
ncbi:MAG: hypothetical protein II080_09100, partial [Lachnospiraceae bacterium]|nr:hypothetical protein [Lachnospiraceae bacterium]